MGNRLTGPSDAYKYPQGETIKHPMGFDIKIDTPLDFMGVTDHSEYVGITREANTPGSYVSTLPEAQPMIMKDPNSKEEQNRVFSYLLSLGSKPPVKAFMDPYKFGMGGGSDSHNSASPYRQDNFFGLHADADGTVERRFAGVLIGGWDYDQKLAGAKDWVKRSYAIGGIAAFWLVQRVAAFAN